MDGWKFNRQKNIILTQHPQNGLNASDIENCMMWDAVPYNKYTVYIYKCEPANI